MIIRCLPIQGDLSRNLECNEDGDTSTELSARNIGETALILGRDLTKIYIPSNCEC